MGGQHSQEMGLAPRKYRLAGMDLGDSLTAEGRFEKVNKAIMRPEKDGGHRGTFRRSFVQGAREDKPMEDQIKQEEGTYVGSQWCTRQRRGLRV